MRKAVIIACFEENETKIASIEQNVKFLPKFEPNLTKLYLIAYKCEIDTNLFYVHKSTLSLILAIVLPLAQHRLYININYIIFDLKIINSLKIFNTIFNSKYK